MITNNPNKNKTLELAWVKEINQRWREFNKAVKNITLPAYITNLSSSEREEESNYMEEFLLLTSLLLLGQNGAWQNKYQEKSYRRAVESFDAKVLSALTETEKAQALALTDKFNPLSPDIHKNELVFLNDRAKTALKKWTDALDEEVKGIIHSGMNSAEVKAAIRKRIAVAKSRAKTIATTETAQAAQAASINQANQIARNTGNKIGLRWVTVGDSKVRHLHAGWHGQIFTEEQARHNMTISPWNCRCGLYPAVKDRIPARVTARFNKERKFLLTQEKK